MLQLLAVLTGDRKAASICNVVNTGKREDAYTAVYKEMLDRVGESAKIERKQVKGAVMTAFYNSKAEPRKIFGEGSLLNTFFETVEDMAPGCWELNEAFLDMWDPEALSNDWVLPDNFHVHVKVMSQVSETVNFLNEPFEIHRMVNAPTKEGRSLAANCVHSIDGMIVREMARRCMYDPYRIELINLMLDGEELGWTDPEKQAGHDHMVSVLWNHYKNSGYLSARILDHISSKSMTNKMHSVIVELVDSLPTKPFKVLSIHDCWRCLPTYGNDLRKQYALQLHLIAKSELLSFLVSQLLKRKVQIGKLDHTLADDILDTDYSLS